jgi:cyclohexanecarboxylate-CoA ligase
MREVVRELAGRAAESDHLAVVDDEGEHHIRALLALAEGLAEAGASSGTVLVQADNTWRTVAAALAAGLGGGVLAVVNRHTTREEFAAIFAEIRPDAVLAAEDAIDEWAVRDLLPAEPVSVLDGWIVLAGQGPRDVSRWAGGSFIGLTSGSTGRPKGVVQSEGALRYACLRTAEINGLARGDAVAAIVPLSSTAAFCFGVYLSLLLGAPLVLMRKWDPATAVRRMAETGVRWTMCVPAMALQMGTAAAGSRALHGVRSITVGGGPMDREALARAEASLGTRILRVFGMSECLGHTSPHPDDPPDLRLGTDGVPFEGTQLRAVSEDGTVLGPNQPGRAQVKGPSLFLGYAAGGRLDPVSLTPEGFLVTGDLLQVHENGSVTIMGREKDVIIRGGRNLDIIEIERAVAGYPRVEQACVVPVPDEVLGERVALLAVSGDGGRIELDEITGHLRELGLSKTKWPEFVYVVDRLPQTKVGKLDRAGAREAARELHLIAEDEGD